MLSTLPLPLLMQYTYPRLFSLHDMPDNCGIPDPDTNEIVLPQPQSLSSERIAPYGLYLLDDGQTQFLWLGRDAIPALTNDVFGVEDKNQVRQGKTTLPELENEFNERVRAIIEKSKDQRSKGVGSIVIPPLYVIREDGEPSLKLWAQTLLVEDRADQGVSVQQFMGMLREKVCFPNRDVPLILSSWPD
jgi:protein transport protein SEC24